MDDGREEIELEFEAETLAELQAFAVQRGETLDETIEYILRLAIDSASDQDNLDSNVSSEIS